MTVNWIEFSSTEILSTCIDEWIADRCAVLRHLTIRQMLIQNHFRTSTVRNKADNAAYK